jgi:hypothetical protein
MVGDAGDAAMMTRIVLAAGLVVLSPSLAQAQQASCKVTLSQYNEIRSGMSYEQAVGILGCEGKNPVFSQLEPHTYKKYSWDGSAPGSSMALTFRSRELTEKWQSGLR